MEITIKPDEIDKYVKDAIINSTVGKIISEKVTKQMNDIVNRNWDNPIDDLIKHILRATVRDLLETEENKEIIKKAVKEKFTQQYVEIVVDRITDKI